MNYERIYDIIVKRGRERVIEGYGERHHIVPKCIGGTDEDLNITVLTAREHYMAHWLLIKIYPNNRKLAYAFNAMCRRSKNQNRDISSAAYNAARKNWVQNHPMKDTDIKKRMIASHHKRSAMLREQKACDRKRCVCGSKIYNNSSSYCSIQCFHQNKPKSYITEDYKTKLSVSSKKFISRLCDKDKKKRLYKSLHSDKVDHIKRGKSISLAKKGKTTNQQQIMGKRLASMSNDQFNQYLANISWKVHNRVIKLRDKWNQLK
jgi:hypothetical protein